MCQRGSLARGSHVVAIVSLFLILLVFLTLSQNTHVGQKFFFVIKGDQKHVGQKFVFLIWFSDLFSDMFPVLVHLD